MRLAQVIAAGELRLVASDGRGWSEVVVDGRRGSLTSLLRLAGADQLLAAATAALSADDAEAVEISPDALRPAADPDRIFCVGRNYREHRDEMGRPETDWPETFLRTAASVTGPFDALPKPAFSRQLDYEGELGVVIGRSGRDIAAADALDLILGFTVVNDVSVRDWQLRGGQWTPGKNFDHTLPIGPVLVTADELDWRGLSLRTRLNGKTVQDASTAQMIFDVPTLIEFISTWTRLEVGDLICTGTPGGVGIAREPALFMRPGDVIEVEIESIGRISNAIEERDAGGPATRWAALATEG